MNQYPKKQSEERTKDKNKKFNFDFKTKKENTLRSLQEVECFLNDFKRIAKHIKLYRLLK